jgi:hypothetical protein
MYTAVCHKLSSSLREDYAHRNVHVLLGWNGSSAHEDPFRTRTRCVAMGSRVCMRYVCVVCVSMWGMYKYALSVGYVLYVNSGYVGSVYVCGVCSVWGYVFATVVFSSCMSRVCDWADFLGPARTTISDPGQVCKPVAITSFQQDRYVKIHIKIV